MRYVVFLLCFLLFGCGITTPEYTAPEPEEAGQTSVIVDQSFDETWEDLIQYTSQRFFAIDNYEKESGLMTLSFSSDPGRFVDCGYIETDGPPSYQGNYVGWWSSRPGNIALDGRMNLTVREQSPSKTRVDVNARYVVTATVAASGQSFTWGFNTGGSDTKTVPANNFGATQERTCQPTHEAEQVIVKGIKGQG